MRAFACSLLAVLSLTVTQSTQAKPPHRIAVARFIAPPESHARQAVLDTLSAHAEVEVVSLEDVEFESRRNHVDVTSPSGRAKVSSKLGINAWIDGEVTGSKAIISLTSADGANRTQATITAPSANLLDASVGERVWAEIGPRVSDVERRRRVLREQAELARSKIAARQQTLERQRKLIAARAERRVELLRGAHDSARKKRAAIAGEFDRQRELVAEAARKQKEADDALWQAELKRIADEAAAAKAEKERLLAEAAQKRRDEEAERQRKIALVEEQRKQAEAEHQHDIAEAERRRKQAHDDQVRQLAEADRQRQLAQAEKQRQLAMELEQRKQAQKEALQLAAAERQRKLVALEQEKRLAEAERERILAEAQHERELADKQRELVEAQRSLARAEKERASAEKERQLAEHERAIAEAQQPRRIAPRPSARTVEVALDAEPSPMLGGSVSPATQRWVAQQQRELQRQKRRR